MALTGWTKKFQVQINSTHIDSDLTDFPVLVDNNTPNIPSDFYSASETGGGDIRASLDIDGTTQLPLEIDKFDNAGELCAIWVKIPTVSSSSNTNFWIWYDKDGETQPAADDTYGSQNVWNSNFKSVWHLDGTGDLADSTSNGITVAEQNDVPTSNGKIGNDRVLDGVSDYFRDTSNSLAGVFANGGTVSCWVNIDAGVTADRKLLCKWVGNNNSSDFLFYIDGSTDLIGSYVRTTSGNVIAISNGSAFTKGSWTKITYVVDISDPANKELRIYVNDTEVSYASRTKHSADINSGTVDFTIGNYSSTYTAGSFDFSYISTATLTADWIKAEYLNQNDTSTFFVDLNQVEMSFTLGAITTDFTCGQINHLSKTPSLPAITTSWSLSRVAINSMTVLDVIKSSLRLINAINSNESPDASLSADSLQSLNLLLDEWSAKGIFMYQSEKQSFSCTADTYLYSMGIGSTWDWDRPISIKSMFITHGDIDYPVLEVSEKEYMEIASKTSTGIPNVFYYNPTYPNGTIYLYPTPDQAYTITLNYKKKFIGYYNTTDAIDYPPGYINAIKYNLALEMIAEFQEVKEMNQWIMRRAQDTLIALKRLNKTKPKTKTYDPILTGRNTFDFDRGF